MRKCITCLQTYKPNSRHKICPKCRKLADKRPCPQCGKLKQRKSNLCIDCFSESKQYPKSKVKHLSKNGYFYVYFKKHPFSDKSGRVFEHRIIMEQKISRYLYPFENVHHKNGIKTDNRIENLELWVKSQPTGARVEDVVKWAKEILRLYGDVSSAG